MSKRNKNASRREAFLDKMPTSLEEVKENFEDARESFQETREQILKRLGETTHEIKPALRGWFHLLALPFAFFGIMILLVLTESMKARAGVAVFGFGLLLLLSISSTYHRTNGWVSERLHSILHRADHASISILIPASCTPFALLLLPNEKALTLLLIIWSLGLLASISRIFFKNTPSWLTVGLYVGLGWIPLFYMPDFYAGALTLAGTAGYWIFWLIAAGGVFYTIGGILFAWRPKWTTLKENVFSYHELFHLFTLIAFACHYASVSLISYNV